jgi:hypothetical protein
LIIQYAECEILLPDGRTEQVDAKAGETLWTKGGKHLPENAGTKPFELILVELKTKSQEK